jgi:hypothetical protein
MANNQQFYRSEHKQREGSGMAIHNTVVHNVLNPTKRRDRMAQAKIVWFVLDFLGIPITILGIIANMDNIKSVILAILGISYLAVRMYFYVIKSQQAIREKELELWHKEMNKIEREIEFKQKTGK